MDKNLRNRHVRGWLRLLDRSFLINKQLLICLVTKHSGINALEVDDDLSLLPYPLGLLGTILFCCFSIKDELRKLEGIRELCLKARELVGGGSLGCASLSYGLDLASSKADVGLVEGIGLVTVESGYDAVTATLDASFLPIRISGAGDSKELRRFWDPGGHNERGEH
jgi:hypothetical protein